MSAALKVREPDAVMRGWPNEDRPMVRLFACGAAALSDSELLAITLRKGAKGRSAVEIAREAIAKAGGLSGVAASPFAAGLDNESIARVQAAVELSRRMLGERMRSQSSLHYPDAVRDYLRLTLGNMEYEAFVCIFLDGHHRAIKAEEMFRGTLSQTSVYPREIVKAALRHNAAAMIFAHNHPSGVPEPSQSDELLTRSLRDALALVDVKVLDHFIIAGNQLLSFAERGLL